MPAVPSSAFLDRLYAETLGLLVQARNYMAFKQPRERAGDAAARLEVCCESLRVTARLTQVLSWVMILKAAERGEVPNEAALEDRWRVDDRAICLNDEARLNGSIPPGLRDLLRSSLSLYLRVARLDCRMRGLQSDLPDMSSVEGEAAAIAGFHKIS
ncbi:MAG: DUF1465 family protein [Alphaproteobacteria bacterium]|nr:DUF1465 family protein [Alphaproteobacteria bacterium]